MGLEAPIVRTTPVSFAIENMRERIMLEVKKKKEAKQPFDLELEFYELLKSISLERHEMIVLIENLRVSPKFGQTPGGALMVARVHDDKAIAAFKEAASKQSPAVCNYRGYEFGGNTPDAICVGGKLYDLSTESGPGIYRGGEIDCPKCSPTKMAR